MRSVDFLLLRSGVEMHQGREGELVVGHGQGGMALMLAVLRQAGMPVSSGNICFHQQGDLPEVLLEIATF